MAVRQAALEYSLQKPIAKQSELLQRLVEDKDQSLRQAALKAIIEGDDALGLGKALQSPYEDIQVSAARAGRESGIRMLTLYWLNLRVDRSRLKVKNTSNKHG